MCGRFTQQYTWKEIHDMYRLTADRAPSNMRPRYNICPTTKVDTVRLVEGVRAFESMRWGLVPSFWKKTLKEVPATFNARVETVKEKPMFRSAYKRNRCLIPASGYYEWHAVGKEKQPYYFTRRDGKVMTIAGLWEQWHAPGEEPIRSCTMIVGEPNAYVADIHDRMPMILEPDQFDGWLNGQAGVEILKPAAEELLNKHPVSKRVNSSRTDGDDPTLIEEVEIAQ
jgi:putative SOS response-associated peptidase YedK